MQGTLGSAGAEVHEARSLLKGLTPPLRPVRAAIVPILERRREGPVTCKVVWGSVADWERNSGLETSGRFSQAGASRGGWWGQQQLWRLGLRIVPQLGHFLAGDPVMSPNRSCGDEHIETLRLPEMLSRQPGPGALQDHPFARLTALAAWEVGRGRGVQAFKPAPTRSDEPDGHIPQL